MMQLITKSHVPTSIHRRLDHHLRSHAFFRSRHNSTRIITASASKPHIAIIGGGVVGLTSALSLVHTFNNNIDITIIAEAFVTNTTTAGSGGLWKPYAISNSDPQTINRWSSLTFDHYRSIYMSPHAPHAGVFLTPALELFLDPEEDPFWKDITPGFRHLTPEELSFYDPTGKHKHGITYNTFIAEGRLYSQWVLDQLQHASNITLHTRKLNSISDLFYPSNNNNNNIDNNNTSSSISKSDFDVVVNCSGLGARELANDPQVHPIRGHVIRVKAPWIRYHVESHDSNNTTLPAYIIPNSDTVVLGGTKEVGREDTVPHPEDSKAILERCTAVVPSLASAEVVSEWVGLRPGRSSVRVEVEHEYDVGDGRKVPVVHNYGHGGSGLTIGYGCAVDVAEMVGRVLLL